MATRRTSYDNYEDYSTGGDQDEWAWTQPGGPAAPVAPAVSPTPPTPQGPPLVDQVRDIYRGVGLPELRGDELQQFDLRMSQGQSPDDILQQTQAEATQRFSGQPKGSAGGGATLRTPGEQSAGRQRGPVDDALQGLYGGKFNQDIVNQRVSGARDTMERSRKSTGDTNRAMLANRGLLGSGPEITAMNRADERLGEQFAGSVGDIYADEGARADSRMMQALGLSAGLESGDADRVLRQFEADTNRTGTYGNLALGNLRAGNDYSLGLGNLGLGRDQLLQQGDSADMNRLVQLVELLLQGAGQGSRGYV